MLHTSQWPSYMTSTLMGPKNQPSVRVARRQNSSLVQRTLPDIYKNLLQWTFFGHWASVLRTKCGHSAGKEGIHDLLHHSLNALLRDQAHNFKDLLHDMLHFGSCHDMHLGQVRAHPSSPPQCVVGCAPEGSTVQLQLSPREAFSRTPMFFVDNSGLRE